MMRWSLVLAALIILGGLVLIALAWWHRRRQVNDDLVIDERIKLNAYRYRFTGADEALAKTTLERRLKAEAIKREARHLETRDDRRSRIHLAGRDR